MIIENDDLSAMEVTPEELSLMLSPEKGNLNVYLVVIELTNCQEFCKVFKNLGVAHVISFKYDTSPNTSAHHVSE